MFCISLEVDRFPPTGAVFVPQQCLRVLFCTALAMKDVVPCIFAGLTDKKWYHCSCNLCLCSVNKISGSSTN